MTAAATDSSVLSRGPPEPAVRAERTGGALRVLVVDDERASGLTTVRGLAAAGFSAETCEDASLALDRLRSAKWDVVVVDLHRPSADGLQFLRELRRRFPSLDVVVTTGRGTVDSASAPTGPGAPDALAGPSPLRELEGRLREIEARRAARPEPTFPEERADPEGVSFGLVGGSPAMREVRERIRVLARHDAPVLVVGETGTGKETVARSLHLESPRRASPFVTVACGTVPRELASIELFGRERGGSVGAGDVRRGSCEHATGGTLFLDDVDEMPLDLQVRLLRVLKERRYARVGGREEIPAEVRVVAATKIDLEGQVRARRYREDLFYRLRGLEIHLPPLRSRGEDVLLLARHFLASATGEPGDVKPLSPAAADSLLRYPWPGNVRELHRAIEAAAIRCDGPEIEPDHLPEHVSRGESSGDARFSVHLEGCNEVPFQELVRRFEDALIAWAMRRAEDRQGAAAELLALPRSTLQGKLSRRGGRCE